MKKFLPLLLACFLSALASAQPASISRNSNLRSGPSTDSKLIRLLPAGTSVTIVSKYPRTGYVRVQTAKDAQTAGNKADTGWVWQKNISAPEPETAVTTPPAPATPTGPASIAAPTTRQGDTSIYPVATFTPGKADPTVTQANLADNICNKAWSTESVRPATSVTNKIKVETMKDYGYTDAANHYELDHLLSLQNGGCPDCKENLWPQRYGDQNHPMTQNQRGAWNKKNPGSTAVLAGALEKDLVENHVHDEICRSIPNAKMSSYARKYPATISITLQRGQEILAQDWYGCYVKIMDGNKPCD